MRLLLEPQGTLRNLKKPQGTFKMKVLIIGQGGREHCIVHTLKKSKLIKKLYAAPGNAGIAHDAECVAVPSGDIEGLLRFAVDRKIDYTVVGPEQPLAEGIVDAFKKEKLNIFGPEKKAAVLESSKVACKKLLKTWGIPTADFKVFSDYEEAKKHLERAKFPLVIKADGLCQGKGVIVCSDKAGAATALRQMMQDKVFGAAAKEVVIEDFLEGEELSIIALSDGKNFVLFPPSQDHKRVLDNDEGPNCYAEDTEILTDDGWKTFDKLKEADRVAVYNPNSREIYFERPQKKYWMRYKGPMIEFKHRNIDLLVTPNHRMLLQQRYRGKKVYVKEAGKYKTEHYIFQSGVWKGKDEPHIVIPEYDYRFNRKFEEVRINFIDWVRFLGIYLSEGYASKDAGRVYIAQVEKSGNFKKIKRILYKLPFKVTYERKNNTFRINSIQLREYLKKFGHSLDKYVPGYIKRASKESIMEFLKAYNLGDGDFHYNKMRFCSGSKKIIDDIQEMIVKVGCSGVITVDKRSTMVNPLNKKTYKANPVYSIEMKKRTKTCIRKNHYREIAYNGHVGCVTVSTGFVVVRRNNRVAISGNTGGMGAYSPVPLATETLLKRAEQEIVRKTIEGMYKDVAPFKGFLYAGLMIDRNNNPYVLEYNVRLGDPETQVLLPRLESDLFELILKADKGELASAKPKWDARTCVCVVLASAGYPGSYKKGWPIKGLDTIPDAETLVFHAGTAFDAEKRVVTAGGRVLNIVALSDTIRDARSKAYRAIERVSFEGMHYRKDIGTRAINTDEHRCQATDDRR